jgi:hypothetical protein
MGMVNYNDYPTLLFLSYDRDTAPDELPFEVGNENVREYLSRCKGFQDMFANIAAKNSLQKENTTTNYLLTDTLFHKIDDDYYFRNLYFGDFLAEYVKGKSGTIRFRDGGQDAYMLLGNKESKEWKKVKGRYICTALFMKNFFIGFEEAVITEKGLSVLPTGHYEGGMNIGGYLSFVLIALAYANSLKEMPLYESEKIKERVYELK